MNQRPTWDDIRLAQAEILAWRAVCTRRRVGALLVKGDPPRIIGEGYNGVKSGAPHCGEGGCPRGEFTYDEVPPNTDYNTVICKAVHAEANALFEAGRDRAKGATLYCTELPCPQCTVMLEAMGVVRVVTPKGSWDVE